MGIGLGFVAVGGYPILQEIILTSPATTIDFNEVNGDAVKAWCLEFCVKSNAGAVNAEISVRINDNVWGVNNQHLIVVGGSTFPGFDTNTYIARVGNANDEVSSGHVRIPRSVSGGVRKFSSGPNPESVGSAEAMGFYTGEITSPVDSEKITKLGFEINVADGFAAGSIFRLYQQS